MKGKIEMNNTRKDLCEKYRETRSKLRAIARSRDPDLDINEKLKAQQELSSMSRNTSPTRIRNRCNISGRSRGYYSKFGLSRIQVRELINKGYLPGVIKR